MARTRKLRPEGERQLGLLVGAGVTVAVAASAVGCSRRTAQRVLARQRAGCEPETLEEVLAALPTLQEVLASFSVAPPRVRAPRRRRSGGWRASAEWLEAERPESWSLPAGS